MIAVKIVIEILLGSNKGQSALKAIEGADLVTIPEISLAEIANKLLARRGEVIVSRLGNFPRARNSRN